MRPVVFFREPRQETCRRDAASGATGNVSEIGEIAGEPFLIVLPHRELPCAVERILSRHEQCAGQCFVVAEKPACDVPQRDYHGTGQCRDVDHGRGLIPFRIGQRIGQNKPAFGIGVQDLDGLPGHAGDNVTRFGRASRRHVFASRDQPNQVDRRLDFRNRTKRSEHGSSAAHIELHLIHVETGFQRDAAGIERDALADQHIGLRLLALVLHVLEHDEARWLIAAIGHGKERPHAKVLALFAFEHLDHDIGKFDGQRLRPFGQIRRRADIGRHVAEIAGEVHPVGNRESLHRGRFARREVRALRYRQRELAQRSPYLGGLALHLLETIDRFHGDNHRVLDAPRHFPALDLFFGQVDDGFVGPGFVEQFDGVANRRPELAVAKIAFLAETDQQHPVGERATHIVQQQRGPELALHVTAADDLADIAVAGAIDQFGRQRQLAIVEYTNDNTSTALLLGAAAFYGKFHCYPSSLASAFC